MSVLLSAVSLCAAVSVANPADYANKVDEWSGATARIATVNAVGTEPGEYLMRLRGEWDFVAQDIPYRSYCRFTNDCFWAEVRKINVPGCWEGQGFGKEGDSQHWACFWDAMTRPLRHQYVGQGWYRRRVTIPMSWAGRRVWIKVGGVNSQAWLIVNNEPAGSVLSYCGTYKFDITHLVTPGQEAEILVDVSNKVPSRKGDFEADHRWGGIWRDIELEATPDCFIDDAWVRGDFDRQEAEVHVEIAGIRDQGSGISVRVTVEGEVVESQIKQSNNQTILKVPLRNFKAWSPEHPNLYTAKVELVGADGAVAMTRFERFGVRKLEVRGREFYLNGRPFFLRGVGWHTMNPMTGIDLPDREDFIRKMRKVKAAGFNACRFHTHCKFPEFFEAADEVGMLLEPELPYYFDYPVNHSDLDPVRDAVELWRNYRRHPSFAIYSGGNEGTFGRHLAQRLYRTIKAMDPDRLVIEQDGVKPPTEGAGDFVSGPVLTWAPGSFNPDQPFVTHEYLNLCIKMDSRLEPRFTGVWKSPVSRAFRREWLSRFGLSLETGDELQEAMNAFQRIWQKYGIEHARMDPYCDGYSYWSLCDVCSPQKEAVTAPSLFDAFYGEKPKGSTAASFAVFNSPDCLLLDTETGPRVFETDPRTYHPVHPKYDTWVEQTNRVFVAGETIPVRFMLARYAERDLPSNELRWELVADGRTLAEGGRDLGPIAFGAVRTIEETAIGVPSDLPKAMKAELRASVGGVVTNSWDFWLFPKRTPRAADDVACAERFRSRLAGRYPGLRPMADAAKAKVLIAPTGAREAAAALDRGQDVVLIDNEDTPVNVTLGWWWLGSQMGSVVRDHAVLRHLPHDGILSQLFFRISKEGTPLPVADVAEKDLVVFGEGGEKCFLYLSARQLGNGAKEVRVSGLDVVSDTPEGTAILDGILDWLSAD